MLGLESLLFVCFALVPFVQTIFIFNLAIDWVIEHGILLDNGRKFFHNIFPVILGLISKVSLELFLCVSINVTDCNWIKVMSFPVPLSGICFMNFVINLHLFFMMLQITVINHVIVSLRSCLNRLASYSLQSRSK